METKLMIAVNYYDEYHGKEDDDNHATMEIFEDVYSAYKFARKDDVKFINAFVADFNLEYIHQEERDWNYEDCSTLYGNSLSLDFPRVDKY